MHFFGSEILNFLGGSIRWFFGTIYSSLFNKKGFTYREYLYGENKLNDDYSKLEHEFANKAIALIFFFIIVLISTFL